MLSSNTSMWTKWAWSLQNKLGATYDMNESYVKQDCLLWQDHPRMSSRCCHFRSRDKDGGHIIWFAVAENTMLHGVHVNITALCFIERELLPIGVLHCGNFYLYFLAPVTLTLTRWRSYANSTCIRWSYVACATMNFLRQGFRKLSSDRHTYRQTNGLTGPKLYTTPLRGWSITLTHTHSSLADLAIKQRI